MPRVIVHMSSMVVRAVIYFLCTLELTIERHFCSILEHPAFASTKAWPGSAEIESTAKSAPLMRVSGALSIAE
jgi:hypothetical protein